MNYFIKVICILFVLQKITLGNVFGQNPISPPGVDIADPTAHVWKDGKVYVYGSVDKTTDYYCSHTHHILSSDDMLNWNLHEDYFNSKGKEDKVPYNDKLLYAPDAVS
ncbi:glycoside hydrolase family protein [Flavicella sediminum]|uniref:hypothetical protein n=1 Tax=Flavicella sediminum TaxID=2585141 RepID=UPI00111DDBE1|nr:hypothetical protein [Flavicella sediminum]